MAMHRLVIGAILLLTAFNLGAQIPSWSPNENWIADSSGCKVWNPNPKLSESIVWSGPCKDGFADGEGTLQWFLDGKPNGRNVGIFSKGKQTSRGTGISANGVRYEGEFFEGRRHGTGIVFLTNGDRLAGVFRENRLDGQGVITRPNGEQFAVVEKDGKLMRVGQTTAPVPGSPNTAPPAAAPGARAAVQISYASPKNPRLIATAGSLRDTRTLEKLQLMIGNVVMLQAPLTLAASECGQVNASYRPDQRTINFCYELVDEIQRGITKDFGPRNTQETVTTIAVGAFMHVALHELGHAMFHIFKVPIFGREEDAADQVATFLLLQVDDLPVVSKMLVGAHWFFRRKELFYVRQHYADEHSVNEQRQFNIACWAYGKNPQGFASLASYARLPEHRKQRCQNEYRQLSNAVQKLLGSNLRGIQF